MGRIVNMNQWMTRLNVKKSLAQSGWNLEGHDPEIAQAEGIMIYIVEPVQTGFTLMGKIPMDILNTLIRKHKKKDLPKIPDTTAAILRSVEECYNFDKNPVIGKIKKQEAYDTLLIAASLYLVQTITFQQVLEKGLKGYHCVVNVYSWPQFSECNVRPFALGSDQPVLNAEDLISTVKSVVMGDKMKHPEWFPSATVTPII